MKNTIIYIAAVMLFLQCKKSSYNDLSGSQTLKGVVILYDTLQGLPSLMPAKNIKVYIKYAGTADGFIYSTTANGQAQYSFQGIDPQRSYVIYASTDTGTVKYYGDRTYTSGSYSDSQSDTLKLYPSQNNQNGIHLRVTDEQLHPVPNVIAWVFNNPMLFNADTSAGRVFDMAVNAYGVSNRFNIAPNTYYLRVKTRIGGIDLTGETNVVVPAAGIVNAHLILRNVPLAHNGIEAGIRDIYNTSVAGATVYCYRSQYLFENDTILYNNSLFTINSNASGLAAVYMITPDTYYLRAVKVINDDTLKSTATVIVGMNNVTTVSMQVQ